MRKIIPSSFLFFIFYCLSGVCVADFNLAKTPSPLTASVKFPKVVHWTEKGARIYFVTRKELPTLDIRLVFDAGAARDGKNLGLASLTNSMLDQGTQKLSETAIANQLEQSGALLQLDALKDMAIIGFKTLTDPLYLEPALLILSEILHPNFPEKSFNRTREQMMMGIQEALQSPEYHLEKAFYKTLYQGHPYENPPAGTLDSLKKLTRKSLIQFYEKYYVTSNLTIALVGTISIDQAKTIVSKLIQQLPVGEKPPFLPSVVLPVQKNNVTIPFSSTQTHVQLGISTLTRQNADYFPLYVANQILGGDGLVSLLHDALREKQGLTYSVDSQVVPMHQAGPFWIRFQTRQSESARAIETTLQTVQHFLKNGPTHKSLEVAKNQIIGSIPFALASNSSLVQHLAMIGFYDLDLNYLENFYNAIKQMQAGAVQKATSQYLDLDKFVMVQVGNP